MVAVVWIVVIFMSITVHEFSHALAASRLGDKTAEYMGRLTLNPIKHIDPIGLIPLVLFGFGWAKPVPFNPHNLKDPRRDSVIIAIAGPASNLVLALVAGTILRAMSVMGGLDTSNLFVIFLVLSILINLFLLFFNMVPIHPLDGSKLLDAVLVKPQHLKIRNAIAHYGPKILLFMIILSLLTNFDVFFFVSGPSFAACDAISGSSCMELLALIFG